MPLSLAAMASASSASSMANQDLRHLFRLLSLTAIEFFHLRFRFALHKHRHVNGQVVNAILPLEILGVNQVSVQDTT